MQRDRYDGHNRKAGSSARKKARRWRYVRRLAARWLSTLPDRFNRVPGAPERIL